MCVSSKKQRENENTTPCYINFEKKSSAFNSSQSRPLFSVICLQSPSRVTRAPRPPSRGCACIPRAVTLAALATSRDTRANTLKMRIGTQIWANKPRAHRLPLLIRTRSPSPLPMPPSGVSRATPTSIMPFCGRSSLRLRRNDSARAANKRERPRCGPHRFA